MMHIFQKKRFPTRGNDELHPDTVRRYGLGSMTSEV